MDNVLSVMVSGLEDELKARINGSSVFSSNSLSPSAPKDDISSSSAFPSDASSTAMNAVSTSRYGSGLSFKNQVGKWMFLGRRGR